MKNATALTAISPLVLEWAQKKGNRVGNKKDKYFYNGYKKQTKEINAPQNIEIKDDEFCISFMGSLVQQFNFDLILELAETMKNDNVKFFICGDGTLYEELKKKTQNLPNVVMTGWLNVNELSYVLSKSKIAIAPYKNTFDFQASVSNKFAEYLSYGLPIIITSDGFMAQLLENNKCGIASENLEKIKNFILTLKKDNIKYKEMSDNAKELFEKNFMADKIYENLTKYLKEIGENLT